MSRGNGYVVVLSRKLAVYLIRCSLLVGLRERLDGLMDTRWDSQHLLCQLPA